MGRSLCTSCCCAAPTILPRSLWKWWVGGGESSLLPGRLAEPRLCRGPVTLGKCHPRAADGMFSVHILLLRSTDDSPKVSVDVVDRWGRIIAATRSRGGAASLPESCDTRQVSPTGGVLLAIWCRPVENVQAHVLTTLPPLPCRDLDHEPNESPPFS